MLTSAESNSTATQVSHFDSEVPAFVMQSFYLFFKEKKNKHNKKLSTSMSFKVFMSNRVQV